MFSIELTIPLAKELYTRVPGGAAALRHTSAIYFRVVVLDHPDSFRFDSINTEIVPRNGSCGRLSRAASELFVAARSCLMKQPSANTYDYRPFTGKLLSRTDHRKYGIARLS